MKRYEIIDGSNLGHCCIEYTVVDTDKSGSGYANFICECLRKEDAEKICDALNKGEKE